MIAEVNDGQIEAATNLLHRFFCEEGFAGDRELIRTNLDALRNDPHHWIAGSGDERPNGRHRDGYDNAVR